MEKTYFVVCKKEYDIVEIEKELEASGGNEFVPERVVACASRLSQNNTMSGWKMSEEEAASLRNDPRILSVLDPITQQDGVEAGTGTQQIGDKIVRMGPFHQDYDDLKNLFTLENIYKSKYKKDMSSKVLTRHSKKYGDTLERPEEELQNVVYSYEADGEGIDIVVLDRSFGDFDNPEFLDDEGKTRFKPINWYEAAGDPDNKADQFDADKFYQFTQTEYNDGSTNPYIVHPLHGVAVAQTCAGKSSGFAKGAHIYSAQPAEYWTMRGEYLPASSGVIPRLLPVDGFAGITLEETLECVRLWHLRKMSPDGNQRPTIIVTSISYPDKIFNSYGMPLRGTYRGQDWMYDGETTEELKRQYKLDFRNEGGDLTLSSYKVLGSTSRGYDDQGDIVHSNTVEILLKQCSEAGIHVVSAAGNEDYYSDIPSNFSHPAKENNPNAGLDFDNVVVFEDETGRERTFTYNQPTAPWFDGVIKVGASDLSGNTENKQSYSNYGPSVGPYLEVGNSAPSIANYGWTSVFETTPNDIDPSYDDIVEVSSFNKRSYYNTLQEIQDLEDGTGRVEFGYQARYYPFSGTDPKWFYYDFSGTSNASPNCAGLLACILEKEPTLTPIQARNRLFELATDKLDFSSKLDDYTDIYTEGYVAFNPYSKIQSVQLEGRVHLESGHNPWLANSYIEVVGGNDTEIQLGSSGTKEIRLHLRDDDGNKIDPALINAMGGGTWSYGIQQIVPNQLIVNDNQILDTSWYYGSDPVTDGYFKATYNTPDVLGTYVITAKVRGEFIAQDPASITRGFDDTVKPIASVSTDYDKVVVGDNLGNNRVSAYYINNVPENVQEIAAVLVNDEFAENPTLTVTSISDGLVYENNFLSVPSSTDYATAQSYQADFVMTDGINSHSFTVYVNVVDQTAPFVNFSSSHGVVSQNGYDVTLTVNEDIGSGLSLLGVSIIDSGTTTATFTSNSSYFVYSTDNDALMLNKNPQASDFINGTLTVTDNSANSSIYNVSLNIADITPPQVSAAAASGSFHLTQSGNDYIIQIDEGIGANQTIVNLSSLDDSLPVSYALGSSTSNEIVLDGSAVKLTVNPDYSGTTTYTAEIISTDAVGNSFTTYITINVVEVLDIVNPVFTSTPSITIDEGINVGSNLIKFEATDDSGVVTYRKFTASDTWFGSLSSALMHDSLYDVDVTGQAYTTAEIDYSTSGLVSGSSGRFFYVGCVAVDPSGNKKGIIRSVVVNEIDDQEPYFSGWSVGDNDQTQFGTTGWSKYFHVFDNFGKDNLTFVLNTSNPNDFTLTINDIGNPVVTLAQAKQIADSPLTFSITATDEAGNEITSPDFTLNIVNDVTGPVFTGSDFVETIPWDAEGGFVVCDNVAFTDDTGVASIAKGSANSVSFNMFKSIYDYDATDNKLKLVDNWQNNYYIGMLAQAVTPHHDEALLPIAVHAYDHTGNFGQKAEFVEVKGSTYTGQVMGHVTGVDISSLAGPQGAYGAQISVNEGSVGDEVARVHLMEYHGSGVHQHTGQVTSPYYRQPVTGSYTLTSEDPDMPDDMFTIDDDGVIRTNIAADADLVDPFTIPNLSGVYNAWLKVTMDDPDGLKMPNGTPEGGQPQVYIGVNILNVDDEAPTWTDSSIHVADIPHPYTGGTLYDASQDVDDPDGDAFPLTYTIAPFFSNWSSPTMLVIDSSTGIVSSSSINTTSLSSVMIVGATITVTDTQGRSASRNIQLNFQPNPWTGTNMLTSWANPTTYPSTSQSAAYNVVDIPYDLTGTTWDGSVLTASDTISERIYIAHEMGGTTPTYFNDFTVGLVQVIDTDGNLVQDIGIGSNTTRNWQTANATGTTLFNGGSSSIVNGIGQFGFSDVTSSVTNNKWTYDTGTTGSGSQGGTGPVGGINPLNGQVPLNVGIEKYSGASNYTFIYRESSSGAAGINYMRTKYDTVNMPTQGSIRIAYHNHGSHNSSGADNSMYVAIGPN